MPACEMDKLWIFDFDGTLSTLVPDRSAARLHPSCKELLEDLVTIPGQVVAILSSRLLRDLELRVPLRGIFLGGGSGMDWLLPSCERLYAGKDFHEELSRRRKDLLPKIRSIASIPGVEIEDKMWSLAVHVRKVSENSRKYVDRLLEDWSSLHQVRKFKGPEVTELQMLSRIDKAYGVRVICDILKLQSFAGRLIYSGDDENDATAMQWVVHMKGVVFTVGKRPLVPGSRIVDSPQSLARRIREMAGLWKPCGMIKK